MKQTIISTITNSPRFNKIERIVRLASKKYGKIIAAGGSLVDCWFDKDFYDVDLFVSVKDLNPQYRKRYTSRTHILDVIRDNIDGEEIDIIVVDYSVSQHIKRFDQNFKKIWYDGTNVYVDDKAVSDLRNNRISVGMVNGEVVYYRLLKSAKKYNMELDPVDLYMLRTFMSCKGQLRIPTKYEEYAKEFTPIEDPDYVLGFLIADYTEYYWKKYMLVIPSWELFKKALKPYLNKYGIK